MPERTDLLKALNKALCPRTTLLAVWFRPHSAPRSYFLDTSDALVPIGEVAHLLDQDTVRVDLAECLGTVLPAYSHTRWYGIVQALLDAAQPGPPPDPQPQTPEGA